MPTLIEVTQEDIDAAFDREAKDARGYGGWSISTDCPVAIAATRAFGTPMRIQVPANDEVSEPGEARRLELHFKHRGFDNSGNVLLPIEAVKRVNTYDVERFMDPFSFEVNA